MTFCVECTFKNEIEITSLFFFFRKQRHEFNYTFNPTEGYRIKLDELPDGGVYTCLTRDDIDLENTMDFVVYVNCKFEINFRFGFDFVSLISFHFISIWLCNIQIQADFDKTFSTPVITSKTENYGIEGDRLEMNCTVEAELGANFHIRWMLPNNDISLKV